MAKKEDQELILLLIKYASKNKNFKLDNGTFAICCDIFTNHVEFYYLDEDVVSYRDTVLGYCDSLKDVNLIIDELSDVVSYQESNESARKSIKESKDITIEEFISNYKNNDCFSIRDKENGHESECFWGSKKDVLDSDYRLFTVLDTDVNKETDDTILYIDLEENAWVESKKSARKSIEESDDNWYKLKVLNEMLDAMAKDEYNIPKVGIYGVTKNINLDEGAIRALIKYYK